jgi:hypothetical protein
LEFDVEGNPPERYDLRFRGKGLARDVSAGAAVRIVTLHELEIRFPYSYPRRPPDVRWLSPILHPNVSFSGFISLRDVGLPWSDDVGLDVVCERLWDVARLAFLDAEHVTNYAAKQWLEHECSWALPIDHRPLRDRSAQTGGNVVRYQRRGQRPADASLANEADDILFIGDDTLPPEPRGPVKRPRRGTDLDDDVLYIGYD